VKVCAITTLKETVLLNFVNNQYFRHKGGFSSFREFFVKNEINWSLVIITILYCVSEKKWCRILALSLPDINRFSKIFQCWTEDEISNKTQTFLPHLKYVAALPSKMQTYENNIKCAQITIKS